MDDQENRFFFRTVWRCARCGRFYLKRFFLSDGFGYQRDCGATMFNLDAHEGWCDQHLIAVEQCTGLKDANKRLIFEGDFIRVRFDETDEPEDGNTHVIKWGGVGSDYPAFDIVPMISDDCNSLQLAVIQYIVEVIGNIHENPELLTEKEKDNEDENG